MCETMTAFSFLCLCFTRASFSLSGDMLNVSGSISTNIGSASKCLTDSATVGKAFTEQRILSPLFNSIAKRLRCIAALQLDVDTAYLHPIYSQNRSSNSSIFEAPFSANTSSMIAFSLLSIDGRKNGISFIFLLSFYSFISLGYKKSCPIVLLVSFAMIGGFLLN